MAPDDRKTPPKGRTNTPRDRDVLVPKRAQTSPYGVPVVTAHAPSVPGGDAWETPDTGTHELAARERERERERDDTPIGLEAADAEAEFRLRNRVKETNINVKATKAATEVGVTTIRTEMQGHVTRLEGAIAEIKTETKAEIQALGGKVETLTDNVIESMALTNNAVTLVAKNQAVPWQAHIDIAANQQKLADKDKATAKEQRRSFWYSAGGIALKILGAAGVVAATAIATHYVERC